MIEEFLAGTTPEEFAKYLDHTILRPDLTEAEVEEAVEAYLKWKFATLVVPPAYVELASRKGARTSTVIGFPNGYQKVGVKVREIEEAVGDGAKEIDVVINIAAIKSGRWDYVRDEVDAIVRISRRLGVEVIKVIIETGLLTDEEKVLAAGILKERGVDMVKTNTGVHGFGATVHDVRLLSKIMPVKASGGIRHVEDAVVMILAGAKRIGTSSGVRILEEFSNLRNRVLGTRR